MDIVFYLDQQTYGTVVIPLAILGVNKIVQLVVFIIYLYYVYQLNKDISNPEILDRQQSHLRKIGAIMGAILGLGYCVHALNSIYNIDLVLFASLLTALFLIQQCMVMVILLQPKKMCPMPGNCVSNNQVR